MTSTGSDGPIVPGRAPRGGGRRPRHAGRVGCMAVSLAVGLVDVKNTWVEPPELVAERLQTVLRHIDAERLHVTPDCGFSQTARYVAVRKLASMVEGVRMVRRELGVRS